MVSAYGPRGFQKIGDLEENEFLQTYFMWISCCLLATYLRILVCFISALSCPTAVPARCASTGLAERLSGVFTGNMATLSVGDPQEMEGEWIRKTQQCYYFIIVCEITFISTNIP